MNTWRPVAEHVVWDVLKRVNQGVYQVRGQIRGPVWDKMRLPISRIIGLCVRNSIRRNLEESLE